MEKYNKQKVIAIWAVVMTLIAAFAVLVLMLSVRANSSNTQSQVASAVSSTKTATKASLKADTNATSASEKKAAESSVTQQPKENQSAPDNTSVADKAEQFVRTELAFYADQKSKHDQLQALSTKAIADKLVPDQSTITNQAVLDTDKYDVTWQECTALVQPAAGTGGNTEVVVHAKYTQSNSSMTKAREYLISCVFSDGQITKFQPYEMLKSQS